MHRGGLAARAGGGFRAFDLREFRGGAVEGRPCVGLSTRYKRYEAAAAMGPGPGASAPHAVIA